MLFRSAVMALTIRKAAMRPSRYAMQMPLFRPGRMPSHGRRTGLVPRRATGTCEPHVAWDGRSGRSGVVATDEVWSRRECAALSCLVSGSWRVTSTARSLSCRCVPPCKSLYASWHAYYGHDAITRPVGSRTLPLPYLCNKALPHEQDWIAL